MCSWNDGRPIYTCVKFICSGIKKKAEAKGKNVSKQVYLQQNKKKAEAESKNCHTKTMLSLEKQIKLIWKTPHMCRLGKSPRSKYEGWS